MSREITKNPMVKPGFQVFQKKSRDLKVKLQLNEPAEHVLGPFGQADHVARLVGKEGLLTEPLFAAKRRADLVALHHGR